MTRMVFILLLKFGYLDTLTACNATEGASKDVERGSEYMQDATKDVKKNF